MRTAVPAVLLLSCLAVPELGRAQVYRQETAPPSITAASASWQVNGEPLFHAGNFYYPAGATVFFDGKIMTRTGNYDGVPLYSDVTLEPFSIVFVPVGGGRMRPYERRRDGELTGTVGSRTPSFPIQRDVEVSADTDADWAPGGVRRVFPSRADRDYVLVPRATAGQVPPRQPEEEVFVAAGSVMVSPPGGDTPSTPPLALPPRAAVEGLWIDFADARWFSAGRAVEHDTSRFERVGDFRGFPVYRERGGPATRIYVTVTVDGPLAPFDRR